MRPIYVISFLCVFVFGACAKKEPPKEVLRPVRFQEVHLLDHNVQKSFSGTASSGTQSNLSFKVSGTITKRFVKVGDRVKKGQLIAELDATDYVLQKKETEASLAQAQAQMRNSKANYDRTRSLYENDSVSKSDLDASRAKYDSDTSALDALQQKLDLADLRIEYTKLYAPINGVVGEILIEVNENAKEGESIVTIESEGDMKVVVGVPEAFISDIQSGDHVSVTFSTLDSQEFSATVSEVSYAPVGSTYPVSVVLNDVANNVRPGMAANVRFQLNNGKEDKKNIVVPSNSVAEDGVGKFVYVVQPLEPGVATVHRRKVEIYGLTNRGFEIKSGLNDGDLVVTAGISKLSDGMKVKFTDVK